MLSDLKIISTGNPNYPGIAKAIKENFDNTMFISRSSGFDLTTNEGLAKFKEEIKSYNVFVNLSHIPNRTQEKLLKIVRDEWESGHVFNIGSIAEYTCWEHYDPAYTKEKRLLRELSLELCSKNFKTTHITVGGFQDYEDSSTSRLDPIEVVKVIKYILESPINIPIIGIEKKN